MVIFIGADHRGLALKAVVNTWLAGRGYQFEDLGAYEYNQDDDYVDFAIAVAQRVADRGDSGRGVVICGSGVGVDVAANKVEGVRSVLGFALPQVVAARHDDNVNVLALAGDYCDGRQAVMLVERFLSTVFIENEKYLRRLEKLKRYEKVT
jgi:RpiB/LacA/LacB family sugar-phosphate isomerase